MIARSALVLLLLAGVAHAQDANVPDPNDEPPCDAAPEAAVAPPVFVPAQPTVARVKRHRGDPVVGFGIVPGYRRYLGSDWIGTSLEFSFGGEAPNGFAVRTRLGLFTGASTFRVPFQHWSAAVVFDIPTDTRLRIELGQTFGLFVIEEPHTTDGYAASPSLGAFLAPTVDLWSQARSRVYLELRLSYDWIPTEGSGSGTSLTGQLGLGVTF